MNTITHDWRRVARALFVLRISVFLVMLMWTLDKFVRPGHAASIFEHFYGLGGFGEAMIYIVAVAEIGLLIGFVLGAAPRWTYGAVFLLHGVSTLSSYRQYLQPFEGSNLLFFAAWPMLGACFALYTLRDLDTLWGIPSKRERD